MKFERVGQGLPIEKPKMMISKKAAGEGKFSDKLDKIIKNSSDKKPEDLKRGEDNSVKSNSDKEKIEKPEENKDSKKSEEKDLSSKETENSSKTEEKPNDAEEVSEEVPVEDVKTSEEIILIDLVDIKGEKQVKITDEASKEDVETLEISKVNPDQEAKPVALAEEQVVEEVKEEEPELKTKEISEERPSKIEVKEDKEPEETKKEEREEVSHEVKDDTKVNIFVNAPKETEIKIDESVENKADIQTPQKNEEIKVNLNSENSEKPENESKGRDERPEIKEDFKSIFFENRGRRNTEVLSFERAVYDRFENTETVKTMLEDISYQVNQSKKQITVQLKPETLGELTIDLRIDKGSVVAKIVVQNDRAKEMVEANLVQLKETLRNSKVEIKTVEVFISSGNDFTNFQGQMQERQMQRQEFIKNLKPNRGYIEPTEEEFENIAISGTGEGLDISV